MVSGFIGNEVPRKGLRVRIPCPPLGKAAPSRCGLFLFLDRESAVTVRDAETLRQGTEKAREALAGGLLTEQIRLDVRDRRIAPP